MALYRTVSMSFWTDSKILDDFSPEEKYFYLYLFTNPHTNLCGCYELSQTQAANEMGFDKEKVAELTNSLEKTHDVIRYNQKTKEVLLLNWHKYNWTDSAKFRKPLAIEINSIKCSEFHDYLGKIFNGIDRVSIGYEYDSDTSVTVTVTVPVTVSNTDTDTVTVTNADGEEVEVSVPEVAKEVIAYLNESTGQHYRPTTKEYIKLIRARLKDNFNVDDFKTVIYKKTQEWKDDAKMASYLRPQTLFGSKFESYLNQVQARSPDDQFYDDMRAWAEGERA